MAKALKQAHPSAPGPDGIPYVAWQRLGHCAQEVLYQAATALTQPGATEALQAAFPMDHQQHTFNHSLMVFLPKKPTTSATGITYCSADSTRPLAIANTDNRLIASAFRFLLEPILEPAISAEQQGFLWGRSMLSNLVEMDHGMIYILRV